MMMPARAGIASLTFGLLAACAAMPARAEEGSNAASPPGQSMDVGDVWRMVRHKTNDTAQASASTRSERFVVVTPSIGSKPSTGISAGFSGNMAFFHGDPHDTHISSISGGLKVSQKGQALSGFKLAMFTSNDRWFVQGDNRLSWTSQNTYGVGPETVPADAENMKYDFFRLYETAYKRVAPGFLVGVGVNVNDHAAIRPGTNVSAQAWENSDYLAYTRAHGFDENRQVSSGTSLGLLYDTRDNGINASRGVYANTVYRTFFDGFLGGNATWQELNVDLRTYRALTSAAQHKLAFWFQANLVTGGTAPYLDLPETGGDGRSARGYSEGRFRGERLLYGEVEYRGSFVRNGLVGGVVFANATTVDNTDLHQKLFHSVAPAAGAGLRVLLNKRSRTNLCTDYAWGRGSRGFYLTIQEAF